MTHRSVSVILGAALAALSLSASAGAATPGSPPDPAFPSDGLRVVHAKGGEAILRFTGTAAKKATGWRGKHLEVTCESVAQHTLTDGGVTAGSGREEGFNGRSLRIGVVGRSRDFCAVRYRRPSTGASRLVAVAAVSAAGRAWVTDLQASTVLLSIGYPDHTPAGQVPNIDQMVAAYRDDHGQSLVEALPDPAAMPPAGRVGYWSDGAHHDVLAVRSPTGRRLFIEHDADDVIRTNVLRFDAFLAAR